MILVSGLACSLGLGMYNFLIALSRGYTNVGLLLIMMIIVFFIYKYMLWVDIIPSNNNNKKYFKSPAGNAYLIKLGKTLTSTKTKISLGEATTQNEPSYLLAVALFGVTILPYATELSALGALLPPPPSSSSTSHDDNDSGCSSCSSGCGGCGSSD